MQNYLIYMEEINNCKDSAKCFYHYRYHHGYLCANKLTKLSMLFNLNCKTFLIVILLLFNLRLSLASIVASSSLMSSPSSSSSMKSQYYFKNNPYQINEQETHERLKRALKEDRLEEALKSFLQTWENHHHLLKSSSLVSSPSSSPSSIISSSSLSSSSSVSSTKASLLNRSKEQNRKNVKQISFKSKKYIPAAKIYAELDERPCEKMFCPFGGTCVVDKRTDKPFCKCLAQCDIDLFAPVCGSDNVTYSSECQLKLASCTQRVNLFVKHTRECQVKDPCEDKVCPFGGICKSSIDGRSSECICPEKCLIYGESKASGSVCGSNGIDYPNSCELKRWSCIHMTDVTVKYYGKCDPCDTIECPAHQVCQLDEHRNPICRCNSLCNDRYKPICASDGKTYANECHLRVQSCRTRRNLWVIHQGDCNVSKISSKCLSLNCTQYGTCDFDQTGQATCVCPPECPTILKPVCGSDGLTYESQCDLERKSCLLNKPVDIKHLGSCETNSKCEKIVCEFGALCDVDRTTGAARCRCPISCTEEYDPVCGTDGISYANSCKMIRESCEKRKKIDISRKGLCGECEDTQSSCNHYGVCQTDGSGRSSCVCPDSCVSINDPVCGTDGNTYLNECQLKVTSCTKQTYIAVESKGRCNTATQCEDGECVCTEECPDDLDEPVCSSDGVTYRNKCEMDRLSCQTNMVLSVKFFGKCSEKENQYINETDQSTVENGANSAFDEETETSSMSSSITEFKEHSETLCGGSTLCAFGSTCSHTLDGNWECLCLFSCDETNSSDIVCASDSVFYQDECAMREASCRLQKHLTLVEPDLCKNASIADEDNNDDCQSSRYGCCQDGKTVSRGPRYAGCPDVCGCNRLGSTGSSCDPITRQCSCKPGVGGLKCDRCEPGFWGLHKISEGNSGCTPCSCNAYGSVRDDCEQTTGRCVCKDGALGMKCNFCSEGQTLTLYGCISVNDNEVENDDNELTMSKTCDQMNCSHGAVCVEDVRTRAAICTCTFNCDSSDFVPVCGSDNNTYGSACQLNLFACRYQKELIVKKKGACNEPMPLTLAPSIDVRTNNLEPTSTQSTTTIMSSTSVSMPVPTATVISEMTQSNIEVFSASSTTSESPEGQMFAIQSSQSSSPLHLSRDLVKSHDLDPSKWFEVPHFSGYSYIKLGHLRSKSQLSLDLEILAYRPDGVLLYNSQKQNDLGDFIGLVIRDGLVEFRYNLGSGLVILHSKEKIPLNRKVQITAKLYHREGLLKVAGQSSITGRSHGRMKTLDLADFLYIGSSPRSTNRSRHNIGLDFGFIGCLTRLTVNRERIDLSYPSSRKIHDQSGVTNCDPTLKNHHHHHYYRSRHSSSPRCDSLSCQQFSDQPAHPSHRHHSLTDYYSDPSFQGEMNTNFVPDFRVSSYLVVNDYPNLAHASSIELSFFSRALNGLIIFNGPTKYTKGDYLWLSLVNGYLEFVYNLGSGPAYIRYPYPVVLDKWHTIKAVRHHRKGSLQINSGLIVSGESKGNFNELNLHGPFYLGGVPNNSTTTWFQTRYPGLNGSIHSIQLNGQKWDNLIERSSIRFEIDSFRGPPCYDSRGSAVCLNLGLCQPQLNTFICQCSDGFTGRRCEKSLTFNQSQAISFNGSQSISFKNQINRISPGQKETNIDIIFKTGSQNGLLVWINRGERATLKSDYLSLAIVSSSLEFSYNLGRQRSLFAIRSPVNVSDDNWHHVTILRNKRFGLLQVDSQLPLTYHSSLGAIELNTNGILWIGGAPNLPTGLPMQYYSGFSGCLQSITINGNKVNWTDNLNKDKPLQYCTSHND